MSHFQSLLNRDFSIARKARVDNGQGGWAIAWTDIGTARGRLRPASGAERTVAQQEQRAITHVLYVVDGEDIQRGDQITGAGVTVLVQGVREPSRADHHLEIDCLDVQLEPTLAGGIS